jgi:hypothetical protein
MNLPRNNLPPNAQTKIRSFELRFSTLLECIVIIAIVFVLIGLLLPSPYEGERREVETKMKTWRPGPDIPIAETNLLSSDVDLNGEWRRGGIHSRCIITICASNVPDIYQVEFRGRWGLWQTTATRNGSRLTLAEAVAENSETIFDTLWIIRVENDEFLVPMARTEEFNKARAAKDWLWDNIPFRRGM